MKSVFSLDDAIRKVPDFPKKGILFYDITSILVNPRAFSFCIDSMTELYRNERIEAVVAIESRGFVFAAPFASRMGLPLVLARKKGKLPGKTVSKSYALEYGRAEIEIHVDDIPEGRRALIVDDLIATGGTAKAVSEILSENGTENAGVFGVVGLPFLGYGKALSGLKVKTLIEYFGE